MNLNTVEYTSDNMKNISSADDKLVLSRVVDTINLSEKRHCACFYGFLNEHEVAVVKEHLHLDERCMFYGGYEQAQRVMFASNADDVSEFPITAVKFSYKKEYKLSHRDFLGALMSLGIERSTVGDILAGDGETIVFLKNEIFDYVYSQISKIGSVGVKLSVLDFNDFDYQPDFDILHLTLSSLRLDVFVSSVCNVSRGKSQQLINSELVSVNHSIQHNTSKLLSVGDTITIRKYGKFVFMEDNGFSKKGKLKISVKHFR